MMFILAHRCSGATRIRLSPSYALSKIGNTNGSKGRGSTPLLTDGIREVRFERATASYRVWITLNKLLYTPLQYYRSGPSMHAAE